MTSANPYDWTNTGGVKSDPDIWKRAGEGTLPDFGLNKDSGSGGGWSSGDWAQKNPKTAGFLKGFMDAYLNKDGTKKKDDEKSQKGTAFGIGATSEKLADGLTQSRDPFFLQYQPGVLIEPGKKGLGRVALEAGIGAAQGFLAGGPTGAVGGTLGSFGRNIGEI